MSDYTYLVDGYLRIGIDAPEQCQTCCTPGETEDDSIPIVVFGDSSQAPLWTLLHELLEGNHLYGDFIVDMLLLNGTCNRYMHVQTDSNGTWVINSLRDKGGASQKIHKRSTEFLQRLSRQICSMNVLTPAQMYAVKNGIPITQKTANG